MKVLVCDPIESKGIMRLQLEGFEVKIEPSISKDELEKKVSEYDVLIVRSRTKVTRSIIERGKKLKVIGRAGSGLDNIDLEAAHEREIMVLNTPEASAESVAELTLGLILSVVRSIALADRTMKEGKWIKKCLKGSLLKGKTLGLIGLGNVGIKIAKIAKNLGMKILVTKLTPPSSEIVELFGTVFVSLETLLKQSDIVSIHVPFNQQTSRMIGQKEISRMKDGAFLLNTSRGGIVDEVALIEALRSGKLGGAGLDVYELEPPKNIDLIKLPNVVCTPHIGAQTKEAQEDASSLLANKIVRIIKELSK